VLDPLSASAWAVLGLQYHNAGRVKEAREAYDQALSINPESALLLANLARLELLEGRYQEALAVWQKLRGSDSADYLAGTAMAEYSLGNEQASRRALDRLIANYGTVSASYIGETIAWRGDYDEAFKWLERAYAQDDLELIQIKSDPMLRRLSGDARYAALIAKLGLPG
jgi:tetratricopeptide (TPR) repeat protein